MEVVTANIWAVVTANRWAVVMANRWAVVTANLRAAFRSSGYCRKIGRFVTPSHTRRMHLRKNPYEPDCGVTTLHS